MNTTTDTQGLDDAAVRLDDAIGGDVLRPAQAGYDQARRVWNAMIDRRPAIIVRPLDADDISAAVMFAREHGLEISIKGGGHNVAGNAVCENGVMVDLSSMTAVDADPTARIAQVQPGALLGQLDQACQAHGLATPAGFISSTGVAGLTLGGGFGYLSRRFGLSVDNVRSFELVTSTGQQVRASATENAELFWGLRGGGGNFGVVTSFEFDLHPLGPQVLAGPVVHAFDDAPAVLERVAAVMRDAPDSVSCLPVIRHAPPAPFIPAEYHGELILLLAIIDSEDTTDRGTALAPLRTIGTPIADQVTTRPYTEFQSMFDATADAGARNYWKAHYFDDLSPNLIATMCDHAGQMTSTESVIGMLSLGGAVARHPADSTPYPHRDANWVLNIQSRWRDLDDDRHIQWARDLFDAVDPTSTGGAYVNFMTDDEGHPRIRAAYGDTTYRRLASLKAEWDPDNVFHHNQNIQPARR